MVLKALFRMMVHVILILRAVESTPLHSAYTEYCLWSNVSINISVNSISKEFSGARQQISDAVRFSLEVENPEEALLIRNSAKNKQKAMCIKMGKSGTFVTQVAENLTETAMVLKALFRMMVHVILILRAVESTPLHSA
jgi:hypothetical protein